MELKTAIEILEYHQEWRQGKRDDMIHEPSKLTEALDIVLQLITEEQQVKNCDLADVVGQRELLLDFIQWLEDEHDIEFITPDKHEQLDIYLSSNSG